MTREKINRVLALCLTQDKGVRITTIKGRTLEVVYDEKFDVFGNAIEGTTTEGGNVSISRSEIQSVEMIN